MTISNLALTHYTPIIYSGILPDASVSIAIYTEITRRLPQNELLAIENKMRGLSPVDQKHFAELVDIGDLPAIIQIKDYTLHALYAVKIGKITQEDFATICLIYASPDPNKVSLSLFNSDGNVNPKARELIQQTLSLQAGYENLLTSQELDSFFEEMAKHSRLQRQFFLEKAPLSIEESGDITIPTEQQTIRTVIEIVSAGLNIFSKCIYNDEVVLMIPSAGMMQTFLNLKFKDHSVRMNFVLGLSSLEDIKNNGLTSSRDVGLKVSGTSLPSKADTHLAEGTDFTYHDFFHAFKTSCASPTTRKKMISLAESIQHIAEPALYNDFVDLEMTAHYIINLLSKEKTPEFMKFFSELESMAQPAIRSKHSNRIFYQLARELHKNLLELKEYRQWEQSRRKGRLENYAVQELQISKAIHEIRIEALTAESEDERDTSKLVILRYVNDELKLLHGKLEGLTFSLKMDSYRSHDGPTAKIIRVLETICFEQPTIESDICDANRTISMVEQPTPSYLSPFALPMTGARVVTRPRQMPSFSSTPWSPMLTPLNVLAGLVAIILLRVFFRKSK